MTNVEHIQKRIEHWESVERESYTGDYPRIRELCGLNGLSVGRGPKDEAVMRKNLRYKTEVRLETLRTELERLKARRPLTSAYVDA